MTIGNFIMFVTGVFLGYGVWELFYIRFLNNKYDKRLNKDESFMDFTCRVYGASDPYFWWYKLRKNKKKYTKERYLRFIKVRGIISILTAIGLIIFVILVKSTEWGIYLNIEL